MRKLSGVVGVMIAATIYIFAWQCCPPSYFVPITETLIFGALFGSLTGLMIARCEPAKFSAGPIAKLLLVAALTPLIAVNAVSFIANPGAIIATWSEDTLRLSWNMLLIGALGLMCIPPYFLFASFVGKKKPAAK